MILEFIADMWPWLVFGIIIAALLIKARHDESKAARIKKDISYEVAYEVVKAQRLASERNAAKFFPRQSVK